MKSVQRTDKQKNAVGVFDNHSFFWKSSLTQERIRQVDWFSNKRTKRYAGRPIIRY